MSKSYIILACDGSGCAVLPPARPPLGRPQGEWKGCLAYGARRPGEASEEFARRQALELQPELLAHIGDETWSAFMKEAQAVENGRSSGFAMNCGRYSLVIFDIRSPPERYTVNGTDLKSMVAEACRHALSLLPPVSLR
jgi:hypothetical protein